MRIADEERSVLREQLDGLRRVPAVDQSVQAGRLVAEGPPQEEVGLEPYAVDPRLNPRPEPADTTALLGTTIPVGAPR